MTRRLVLALVIGILAVASAGAQPGPTTQTVPPPPSAEMQALMDAKPRISLVTMGVGGLIWERHGHIALCVEYENRNENACYNYGVGDFHHPLKMAWGFFRASGAFWVDKQDPQGMLAIYHRADRTIWVQPLPLTAAQKDKVLKKLEYDILEEHKHYSYDHFWDNCTTRVRDIIDDATDHALSTMPNQTDGRSYRELAREGFRGLPRSWLPLLITDLGMGRVTDAIPSYWERMFLPDYLREAVIAKWGIQPTVLYQRKGPFAVKEIEKALGDGNLTEARKAELQARLDALHGETSGRVQFALLVLLLTSPAWLTRLWGRFQRTGLAIAVIPPALLGVVFWMLSAVSVLPYVRWNETALCFVPLDFALLFLGAENKQKYARGRVVMGLIVAALLLVNVLHQPIWPALLWGLVPNLVVAFMPIVKGKGTAKPVATATAAVPA